MRAIRTGILALILGVGAVGSVFAADLKIGIIDPQELFNKSPQAKKSEDKIIGEFKPREDKVIALKDKLEKEFESYQKDKEVLSPKERLQKERDIGEMRTEFQRMAQELDQDIRIRRNEELSAFDKVFKEAVEEVAKKNTFDLIFPTQAVIYSAKKIDITEDVLSILKKKGGK